MPQPQPGNPILALLFINVVLRLLGSDDFSASAEQAAAADLSAASTEECLEIPIAPPLPLEQAAAAHDQVEAGSRQRLLPEVRAHP